MSATTESVRSGTIIAAPRATCYAMYGRRVLSEIPLPVPVLPGPHRTTCDWVIRRGVPSGPHPPLGLQPIAEDRGRDGEVLDRFYRTDTAAWLWDRRAGTCHLEPHAGRVTVYPTPDVDEDDLGLLLIGPIASFLLHQAGSPNLHASAVVTQHGACAFVGPSTFGKSTLAASLLRNGARLLTDDILPLRFESDGVYGVPGPAMMKLWPATAHQTLGIAEELPCLTSYTDKRLVELQRHRYAFEDRATRLRAIYVPRRYDPVEEGRTEVVVEPLTMREAVLLLLSQTFRGDYLYPQELAGLLGQFARLSSHTRVAVLRMPHGLEYQSAVSERIILDLAAP
jgi:hypothetical protein